MIFIVTYELAKERPELIAELKESPGWWHYIENTWLISTEETATQVYDRLVKNFKKADNLLIVEFDPDEDDYKGWLPSKAWDWFKENK